MGPELLRVKDLACLSNSYGELDYNIALKVLQRIYVRRHHGIVIFRFAAGKEIIPSSIRLVPTPVSGESYGKNIQGSSSVSDDIGNYIPSSDNEITKNCLCQGKILFSHTAKGNEIQRDQGIIFA
jgi:hypothetical protein